MADGRAAQAIAACLSPSERVTLTGEADTARAALAILAAAESPWAARAAGPFLAGNPDLAGWDAALYAVVAIAGQQAPLTRQAVTALLAGAGLRDPRCRHA